MRTLCLLVVMNATLASAAEISALSLIGRWKHVESPQTMSELVFREDGTFSGSTVKDGAAYTGYEGKWLIRGASLYYLYTKVSSPYIKPGQKDKDTILEIGRDYFVLKLHDGRTSRYERISTE